MPLLLGRTEIDELRALTHAAEFRPALRHDDGVWKRDGQRCPIWLSSGGLCPSTLLARLDHRRFGRRCLAVGVYLVSPRFADPAGIWVVKVMQQPGRMRWYITWLGQDLPL